jgi:hypothetical protein
LVDTIHVVEDCIEELVREHLMRLCMIIIALLAALVALYSFRFFGVLNGVWFGVDPGIREVIAGDPVGALTHMLVAPVALLLGPFQFIPRLRESHRAVHRWTGRVYVAACVIAGFAGPVTAFHASGGPVGGGVWYIGDALDRHHGFRKVGSHAAPIRSASTAYAIQLRLDFWSSDLASSNPDWLHAGL